MWKLARPTSHGGKSVRSILTFALAAILTVFFATTTLSSSYAAPDTATWNGQSISYDSKQFIEVGTSSAGDKSGIPAGSEYYEYTTDDTATTTAVIYYPINSDNTKPVTATYAVYDINKATSPPSLTNPHSKQSITISGGDQTGTTCAVAGIGWIVCPVSNFIASGMDTIFGFLTQFVRVQPIKLSPTNNPLFTGWNMMRGIANIAFIIAFMVIIYSQITSVGVTNYGLKKLLPRLILSALLVNLSYYIAAIAVDFSNIIGTSIQDFFSSVSHTVFNAPGHGKNVLTWTSMTAFVLSGGTAAVAGGIGLLAATGGTASGLIFLLLPALVGLLLTILVVLLVLAARQALIVILIIIAPVAFVAYLLPNTEKWFNRWRETFMAMLIFFPAFSAVYAGAQLAGQIIIVNASSLVMLILGMAVQLAPLVITPWLLKLSTGVLGRVAGMIHNGTKPSRSGLKNWADKNREYHRQRGFSYNPRKADGSMKKSRFARSRYWAANINNMDRDLDEKTNNAKAAADNIYHKRDKYADLHKEAHHLSTEKEIIENALKTDIQGDINIRSSRAHLENVRLEAGKIALDKAMKQTTADMEEYKTTRVHGLSGDLLRTTQTMRESAFEAVIEGNRAGSAQHVQNIELRERLLSDATARDRSGGVAGIDGANSVLAAAVSAEREAYNKSVGEARAIIKHFNLSSNERQAFAIGKTFQRAGLDTNTVVDAQGAVFKLDPSNKYVHEAAIEDQLATGTVDQINQIVMRSGSELADFRTTISQAVADNKLGAKTIYLGGKTLDDIAQGRIKNETDLKRVVLETIAKGKISERDLSNADQEAVELLANMASAAFAPQTRMQPETASILATMQATSPGYFQDLGDNNGGRLVEFSKLARDTLTGDDRVYVKPNAKRHILRIARLTDPDFVEPDLPRANNQQPPQGQSGNPPATP